MADTEKTEENDTVTPEIKTRGLQRAGNFRKIIRKKYSTQQSDPGYTERKMYSSEERPELMTKSSTMPNMPTYGSQSISSESSADSSYISMDDRNASIDTKERNFSVSSDVSSDVNYGFTNAFSTFAQNTISDFSSRIQTLKNISKDKESNDLSDSDISNRKSNGVKTNQAKNGRQLDQNHSTNKETCTINQSESTNNDTASSVLDETLQVIGPAATSIGVDLARGVGELTSVTT